MAESPGEENGYPLQYSCLRYPQTEEPGGLQSMGLQRVGHDGATNTQYVLGMRTTKVDKTDKFHTLMKTTFQ